MTASPAGSAPAVREREFLAFADRSRALLRGCALLMAADPERADRLAESVLARSGGRPPRGNRLTAALQDLVRPRPGYFAPPWSTGARVELREGSAQATPPLLAELQRLAPEPRAALVLLSYAGLSSAEAAAVLQTSAPTVEMWAQQAYAALVASRPGRLPLGWLPDELRAAVAAHLEQRPPSDATADLTHARQLVRRRRSRNAAALVAAALVLALGVLGVVRIVTPTPEAAPPPAVSTPSPLFPAPTVDHPGTVTAQCDIKVPSCQATVMRDWRSAMAEITANHLDPTSRYFTGYNFSYTPRYETPSFWKGGDGALGLDVFGQSRGGTQIYLQIATGYANAVRCGQTTGQSCVSQRFMDGNRFSLSTHTQLSDGIEVQYSPDGDQVITVVARNLGHGRALGVTRGDLINLVQDPRLRLPVI